MQFGSRPKTRVAGNGFEHPELAQGQSAHI